MSGSLREGLSGASDARGDRAIFRRDPNRLRRALDVVDRLDRYDTPTIRSLRPMLTRLVYDYD